MEILEAQNMTIREVIFIKPFLMEHVYMLIIIITMKM